MEKLRALVVDDLVLNRILLCEIIEEIGFDYKMVGDGKQAIAKLREEHFDIVFMDIEMPVMNGFEAIRFIRNKMEKPFCNLPVVAVSAHDPVSFWEDYQDSGFDDLLSKPFSIKKIKRIIETVMNKRKKNKA